MCYLSKIIFQDIRDMIKYMNNINKYKDNDLLNTYAKYTHYAEIYQSLNSLIPSLPCNILFNFNYLEIKNKELLELECFQNMKHEELGKFETNFIDKED